MLEATSTLSSHPDMCHELPEMVRFLVMMEVLDLTAVKK